MRHIATKQRTGAVRTVAMTAVAGLLTWTAQAASISWTGSAGNGLWTDAGNWSVTSGSDDDGIPDGDDDVTFPTGPTYAGGITLNGNQACNSLTYATIVAFDLKATGDTLTITSGALNQIQVTGNADQQRIYCNLYLPSAGTNVWNLAEYEAGSAIDSAIHCLGSVSTPGAIRKTGARKVSFKTANSFGLPPIIQAGVFEANTVTVGDALGTGTLTFDGGGLLYVRGLSQTLTNAVVFSGGGTSGFAAYGCTLTLESDFDVPAGRALQFGNTHSDLIVLQNTISGDGNLIINRCGAAFDGTDQFTTGNLNIGSAGGAIILDGLSWTAFTNHYSNGYGTGARQWQMGKYSAFAARTAPLVMQATGQVGGGATAKTWFDAERGFGPVRQSAGDYSAPFMVQHADARVELQVDVIG